MSRAFAVLAAVLLPAGLAAQTADSLHTARVTYVTGGSAYIDAGRQQGLREGAAVELMRGGAAAELARLDPERVGPFGRDAVEDVFRAHALDADAPRGADGDGGIDGERDVAALPDDEIGDDDAVGDDPQHRAGPVPLDHGARLPPQHDRLVEERAAPVDAGRGEKSVAGKGPGHGGGQGAGLGGDAVEPRGGGARYDERQRGREVRTADHDTGAARREARRSSQ